MVNTEQFSKKKYLNLETFRKNGEGVRTPVWFVQLGEKIYVITMATSWKVKRIRRESRVNIAPCRVNGQVIGQWQQAIAQETQDTSLQETVNQLYRKKYGLLNKILEQRRLKDQNQNTTLEIVLDDLR